MSTGAIELLWTDPKVRASRCEFGRNHAYDADIGRLIELAEPTIQDKALDLVTGLGFTAIALGPNVKHVDAIDPDEEVLREAVENSRKANVGNIKFMAGEPESIPAKENEYDLVAARMAFRHEADPSPCLKEIYRVLKPGGRAVVTDCLKPIQSDLASFFENFISQRDCSHVKCLNVEEWESLLDKEGFDVGTIEIFPREYDFEQWAGGAEQDKDAVRMLTAVLRGASTRAKHHFRVVEKGSKLISFITWMILMRIHPRKSAPG
jgi:ubiquinone/menaquinone biosynthesis C-methylase UbiE